MLNEDYWQAVISQLRSTVPVDLDDLVDTPSHADRGTAAAKASAVWVPPSAKLWTLTDHAWSTIGVRVSRPVEDPVVIALRLASAAVERHVVPIMMTPLARSGFERFGLRTERIGGRTDTERAAHEAELARFWGFAIIFDAEDVALLG